MDRLDVLSLRDIVLPLKHAEDQCTEQRAARPGINIVFLGDIGHDST